MPRPVDYQPRLGPLTEEQLDALLPDDEPDPDPTDFCFEPAEHDSPEGIWFGGQVA